MKRRLLTLAATVAIVLLGFGQTGGDLVPAFSMRPAFPMVGDVVQFRDLSSGTPTSWLWEFGDGTTSTERNPTHVYAAAGEFSLTFTVDDGTGPVSITWPGRTN